MSSLGIYSDPNPNEGVAPKKPKAQSLPRCVSTSVTFSHLVKGAEKALIKKLGRLKLHRYGDILAELLGTKVVGVYLIYDELKELLYVGQSEDVRSRLYSHTRAINSLLGHIVTREGYDYKQRKAHKCECGIIYSCSNGDLEVPAFLEAQERARNRILSTFFVAVIPGNRWSQGSKYIPEAQMEKVVQWALRPRYGYFQSSDENHEWKSIGSYFDSHPQPDGPEASKEKPVHIVIQDFLLARGTPTEQAALEALKDTCDRLRNRLP